MSYDPQNEITLMFYLILSTESGEFVCGSWGLKGQHYCISSVTSTCVDQSKQVTVLCLDHLSSKNSRLNDILPAA